MTVLITLTTAGVDSGPFDLYSNLDGYVSAFETGVSKASLLAGYSSALVPDYTDIIRIKSDGICINYIDVALITTTTSTTSTTSTTTTTTTTTASPTTTTTTTTAALRGLFIMNCESGSETYDITVAAPSVVVVGDIFRTATVGLIGKCWSVENTSTGPYTYTNVLETNIYADCVDCVPTTTTTTTTAAPPPSFYNIDFSNSTPSLPCGSPSIPTTYPLSLYCVHAIPVLGDFIYTDSGLTSTFPGDGTFYWISLAFGFEINGSGEIISVIDCS